MIAPRHLSRILVGASLVIGTAALAQSAPASQPASDSAAPQKEKLICRTEGVIGSHAKKRRVCLTKAEWDRVAREGNAYAYKIVESGRAGRMDSN